ncbi:MAG: flagellar basal body L-ring protein FlgH [Verrucomicrobiae bacterium]|nr:flagellar basal body L-ring protein FlgH [Verrucomicrobiae bacterium]
MNKPSSSLTSLALAAALPLTGVSVAAQSLWKDDTSQSMFADKRARAIGDIVTILVQESTSASKENGTKTSRSSGIDAAINTFLYSPAASGMLTHNGKLPAVNMAAKTSFDGGGQVQNAERMTARIAVRVVDVLPNNNLVIEGRRQTKISGETTEAILRGVVRVEDVTANNTVFSYNVADATIQYLSKGPVSDAQRKGWFTKVWDKVAPF